jgi:hypothetical protein
MSDPDEMPTWQEMAKGENWINPDDHLPYEIIVKKVVYYAMIGTWGDGEGRTWAKEIPYCEGHPTLEKAQEDLVRLGCTGTGYSWKANRSYGLARISKVEELIDD